MAGADQVAITISIVDAVDRRPIFVDPEGARRIASLFAGIGTIPFTDEVFNRVRGVLERIVVRINAALGNVARLFTDRQHGIAKAVQLGLGLRLGRLDH